MGWMPTKTRKQNSAHATSRTPMPLARSEDLVVEELAGELLIYDQVDARAHCLSAAAARVWRSCDGYTTTPVLANKLDMDEDSLVNALAELEDQGLLVASPQLGLGHTRREFSRRSAKIGAAAVAAPLIMSIVAPVAEATATPTPAICMGYNGTSCNGCTGICGCCCCCQGGGSCKLCYPTGLCSSYNGGDCGGGSSPGCSATAKAPPDCSPGTTCGASTHACGCTYHPN